MSSNPSAIAPVRKDARVVRSRAALRAALLELLADHPLDQITIRQISARAGSGYATFFRHYPDKAALLADIAEDEIAELFARSLPMTVARDTLGSCIALCRFIDERRALWTALLAGAAADMRAALLARAREAARDHGALAGSLPTDFRISFGVGASIELFSWWLDAGRDMTPEQMGEILDRLVVAPLTTP